MEDLRPDREERFEFAEPPRKKRLLPFLIFLVLCAFAAVVWYAYQQGNKGGIGEGTPLIKAEEGPIKIRPDQPGGMEIPHQDKMVYDELEGKEQKPAVEKLLPPPEQPKLPEIKDQSAAAATEAPKTVEALPMLDAKDVRELPKAEMKPAVKPAEVKEEKKKVEAKKPVETKGAYSLQLASLKDKAAAEKEKDRLVSKNKDLLGSLNTSVVEVDLAGKGIYYRIYAGNFATKEEAQEKCNALKAGNITCIAVPHDTR
jgi:cell division protein FtsN